MTQDERTQALERLLPFWDILDEADRALIVANAQEARYAAGEQVRGQAAECLGGFVVLEGMVRAYLVSDEGKELTISRLRPDEPCMLGASCVLHSIAFDVLMEAEQDTRCLLISPAALEKVFEHNLAAENWSLNALVDRLSDIMWNMQQVLFTSFDKRLAAFLYEESVRTGSDAIKLTQEQIAKHLGSAREVVSRMLGYFAGEGVVKAGRGQVQILDRDRLRKMAV